MLQLHKLIQNKQPRLQLFRINLNQLYQKLNSPKHRIQSKPNLLKTLPQNHQTHKQKLLKISSLQTKTSHLNISRIIKKLINQQTSKHNQICKLQTKNKHKHKQKISKLKPISKVMQLRKRIRMNNSRLFKKEEKQMIPSLINLKMLKSKPKQKPAKVKNPTKNQTRNKRTMIPTQKMRIKINLKTKKSKAKRLTNLRKT